ncbi:hypothetical protein VCNHCC004A_003678B, partial [Vibrio cholerae O1 str. NHCC-004A]
PMSRGGCSCCV